VIRLMPALNVTAAEIEQFAALLDRALNEVLAAPLEAPVGEAV
jgi:4-aminobutyrate aminotransferase-like enzyme